MGRIVQKFGGTSVANVECIKNAANKVLIEHNKGNQVIVVVSAMAGTTNQLIDYIEQITDLYDPKEYDVIVSAGEQWNAGLMALALQNLGLNARSWLGWQIAIQTDQVHSKARILGVEIDAIETALVNTEIVVVPGFQGVSNNRITTLGRGGSDLTAVALAGALNADRCDIFTDVDGIYTADPRLVSKAQKLGKITYEEMLEMASLGSKVLQTRSVELAMNYGVNLQVRSSFDDKPGTIVVSEEEIVEQQIVSGISQSKEESKITLLKIADKPGIAASIFGPLADASINVDMIVQNISEDGNTTDLTFTVSTTDLKNALEVLETRASNIGVGQIIADSNVVKISVVGIGMRSHAGIAQKMFMALADKGINIKVISTSEIKVSVLVAEEYGELAVRALHSAYGLDSN
ncbi:MAG: aspartate kinase [Rhodospirillaceae bacterium]|nr:aspartate kinase [Rhodospirillaceae bacterium]